MGKVVGVMGESGSGKTTSMRNLDPETTFYIDCDKKGLSWKGWRNQYNAEKKNYVAVDDADTITGLLAGLSGDESTRAVIAKKTRKIYKPMDPETVKELKRFKTVVIDTVNSVMVMDEVRRMREKGYDKWIDLAQCIWGLLDYCLTIKSDLTVIMVFHCQTQKDDDGYIFSRIKTNGKKLNKLEPETKLPVLLFADVKDGEHIFHTRADHSTAKAPMGAFNTDDIPNDISLVIKALEEF